MYSKEELLEMLSSSQPSVRYEACEALRISEESSPEIINALEMASHDLDKDVAARAKLALQTDVHHQMAIKMGIVEPEEIEVGNNKFDASGKKENCCPKCNAENPEGAQLCNFCGASLSIVEGLPKRKSRKKLWIILGSIAGILILAVIICSFVIGNLSSEAKPITKVAEAFMKNLVAKDVESAYALTSPSFQEQIPIDNLKQAVTGDNYRLLEGYQSLKITNIKVTYGIPQTGEVSGTLTYNDTQGEFTATLEKVNDTWMISAFNYQKNMQTQP